MKNLVYLSTARTLLNDDVLLDILSSSRKNNKNLGVTGVLLYCEGAFIQVLEGGPGKVDEVFNVILKDIRHKNIVVLMDEEIESRSFPSWTMGFTFLDAAKSGGFIESLTSTQRVLDNGSSATAIEMLNAFIKSNNLQISY